MATSPGTAILRKNLIINCFNTLRKDDQFVKEGSSRTNFEVFWDKLNHGFSLSLKPYKPSNSAVEAFYRGSMPIDQFLFDVEENVIKKSQDKLDSNLDPLLTISWDVFCSHSFHKELCERVSRLCGRQIWAIYNKLDIDSTGYVDINDITELILKIFYSNGKSEDPKNIHEWFCEQSQVDFWSFFSALIQNHIHLIQLHVVQELYEEIVHEILKQGKMTKKGHKVQTWKERWFVLTSSNLYYYESLENRIQKGVVTINSNTKVMQLPSIKGRNYLFQVTDGVTNRPYDISAPDPQVLKDWVETVQVVVAAQSTQGRTLLHRLSLARDKLFPNHTRLPSYTPSPTTPDYNEGIYRVVRPTSPIPPPTPPVSSTTNSSTPLPESPPPMTITSIRSTPEMTPLNGSTSIPIHQPSPSERSLPQTEKKQGPPVAPYHKTSTSKIEHVNVDGHDYALVDKLLEEDQNDEEPPPPPVPKQRDVKGPPPDVKPYAPQQLPILPAKPRETRVSESESAPPPPVPKSNNGRPFSPVTQPTYPLPPPKDSGSGRPFSPVTSSQYPFTDSQSSPSKPKGDLESRPAPKPRNKLGPTKSVPATSYISPEGGSYAQLTFSNFDNSSSSDEPVAKQPQNQVIQQPKVPSSSSRTKYDYSDVIVSPVVTKDIDKALELKANKSAPPLPPPKYDPSGMSKRKSTSDSSLPLNESPPLKPVHTYQNVHYTGGGGGGEEEPPPKPVHTYQNVHYTGGGGGGEEEPPPPPVPRRMESCRNEINDPPLHTPSATGGGPLPPIPRSPRKAGGNPSALPPLPPR